MLSCIKFIFWWPVVSIENTVYSKIQDLKSRVAIYSNCKEPNITDYLLVSIPWTSSVHKSCV